MNNRVIFRWTFSLMVLLLLSGCSKTYMQIFDTEAKNVPNINDQWVYENDTVSIIYSFWASGGAMSFAIYNKTDRPLFIDWKNSALIINDQKLSYWIDRTVISSSGTSTSSSHAYSTTNTELPVFNWAYVLQSTMNTSSATATTFQSHGTMVKDERITSLPPHAYVGMNRYRFREELWKFNGPNARTVEVPKANGHGYSSVSEEDFRSDTSPLRIRNFVALSFSETMDSVFYVDNSFWVSRVREMGYKNFQGRVIGKDEDRYPIYEKAEKRRTAFYWKYEQ
ncbi:MAG: hypothetical protein IPL81_01945 [Flavobacteriales bacterium]|nr:hypothetical protein [Flavobacteriales bacterium]MBK7249069.1 hypothetical protein [Flavobacteriales bacterium]MBK9058681.1 hypothetical protein [Flavobacteriales bacterium]QQS71316.1 MAG: hypothetical protein IPP95_08895 [Flavobacteriales bacterium]HQV38427.1 hypothetical protein [Flavobacteriales bacterium]